jgi:putative restriction endonuclease
MAFAEAEAPLENLPRGFGPTRLNHRPAYPFVRLQSDGLWTMQLARPRELTADPTRRQLVDAGAEGRLVPGFETALRSSPQLFASTARLLLDANFPESLHEDICKQAGLDLEALESQSVGRLRKSRSPEFREAVLVAYEYRCAICGYDGLLGTDAIGLDAAHVRWWAFEGPDEVSNALCLCSLHHKLFDRGAMGISPDFRVLVSMRFIGRSSTARAFILGYAGQQMAAPQSGQPTVELRHIEWHHEQVFRGPERTTISDP